MYCNLVGKLYFVSVYLHFSSQLHINYFPTIPEFGKINLMSDKLFLNSSMVATVRLARLVTLPQIQLARRP